MMDIKKISLSGTPEEIGDRHGQLLTEEIQNNIEFYRWLLLKYFDDEAKVLEAAAKFKESIQKYNPDYVTEIDHIAIGAGLAEPLWLYALNARTELSMLEGLQECTAIVCPRNHLLAQTWDWAQNLEGNFVIMSINFPNGHQLIQLTEAGIIGKIGLNNQGLGVTLNFLFDEQIDFDTVPIHILMRQILECSLLDEAKHAARRSGIGKASNLIIAQGGKALNIEFAGDVMEIFEIENDIYAHTNHFLHAKTPHIVNADSHQNSVSRHHTALTLLQKGSETNANQLRKILSDQTNDGNSILASYKPDPLEMLGAYGTLATVVMDLESRMMFVRNGNPKNGWFSIDKFVPHDGV